MSTKIRIISGFIVMIIILTGVSIISYTGLNKASTLFLNFVRVANLKVATSDIETGINTSAYYLEKFMRLSDDKDMDRSVTAQQKTFEAAEQGLEYIETPELKTIMEQSSKRLQMYVEELKKIGDTFKPWYHDYQRVIRPGIKAAEKNLGEVGDLAVKVNNIGLLRQTNDIWRMLVNLEAAISGFREHADKANADAVDKLLEEGKTYNEHFSSSLITEDGKRIFFQYQANFNAVAEAYRKNKQPVIRAEEILAEAYGWDAELEKASRILSQAATEAQNKTQADIIASNDSALNFTLVSSAAGLLVGVLFAVFIIFKLITILHKVSAYAEAIAEGDFKYEVAVHEKGEIGKLVNAIHTIPSVLNDILDTYKKLAHDIQYGRLQSQVDTARFKGSFATLIDGTNNIVSTLRGIIDSIPTPVVLMNKETKVEYLNRQAAEVAGADGVGKTCRQLFNREDTDTPGDALSKAIASGRPAAAETRCKPRGREMDISYSALPILDKSSALTAVLLLITDLTAIKETGRTILKVAGQASGIASRVAAASEELSAQVEEVSRGAEAQRARVEETAGAMSEMNSTVLEVARNAGQASEQSGLTNEKARNGAQLVNQVVGAINHVNTVAATLQGNMQELGTQAESIGGVMNVISDIADQTNLLALNAAIEAARAGEAGRGFAVVADEVRKLAEKTMSATQEVGSSIRAIQQSTKTNIQEVSAAVGHIGEATELADASGEALKEIVELATANSSVVASIATAAEEQSSTSEEINRSIDDINRIVGETSNGMVQSSAAVQELSQMAQELNRVMEQLTKQ
ncbi:MAG: methyl-accepting chemotaxis protein [Desulfovibrio sp.]|jgi:methyl-accepting chemotaxis protein|nr:methyl-accepting chemotaxis protein [Desulfovibrio sp.]